MDRGDIHLVTLDPTSGHEQQCKRPVLIISPGKFKSLDGRSGCRADRQRWKFRTDGRLCGFSPGRRHEDDGRGPL